MQSVLISQHMVSMDLCSICLEENDKNVYCLDCKHNFHAECIFQWLETQNTCPLCRSKVIMDFVNEFIFDNLPIIDISFDTSSNEDDEDDEYELRYYDEYGYYIQRSYN
jgi:hypothetical protein